MCAAELSCAVFVLVVVLSLFCGVNGESGVCCLWFSSEEALMAEGLLLRGVISRKPGQKVCTYLEFERVPDARKVP